MGDRAGSSPVTRRMALEWAFERPPGESLEVFLCGLTSTLTSTGEKECVLERIYGRIIKMENGKWKMENA